MEGSNTIYIKGLIVKLLKKELTAEEAEELAIERAELTEDQYDELVVEVLSNLEGELPDGFLDSWSPDYKAIEKRPNQKSQKKMRKFKRIMLRNIAASIVALVSVLFVFYFGVRYFGEDSTSEVIAIDQSSFRIFRGDSVVLEILPDAEGVLYTAGNLQLIRMQDGLLVFDRVTEDTADELSAGNLVVYTPPQQQCLLELEDGSLVRLNAQSYIKYPIEERDRLIVYINGEGYIKRKDGTLYEPLEIRTSNGYIVAQDADFLVRAFKDRLIAVLDQGNLDMFSYNTDGKLTLHRHENLGSIVALPASESKGKRDTLVFADRMNFEKASLWTKEVRDYKDYPLRAYVEEMSRWYGFVIKDWDCFPNNKVVNAKVRYDDPIEVALAALHDSGVVLYEENGLWTLCPENKI